MKKFLKCFALTLIVALFTTTMTTFASSNWQCTVDNSDGDWIYKEFVYSPMLAINNGGKEGLPNNATNGGFLVHKGQTIDVTVDFDDMYQCNGLFFNQSTGKMVYSQYFSPSYVPNLIMTASQTGYYVPIIECLDSSPIGVAHYIVRVY